MTGLEMGAVRISEYDAEWKKLFEAEHSVLEDILAPIKPLPRIEHVGSTAVPQAAAKPIVDIAIGFARVADVPRGLALMVENGFDYVKAANQPGMLFLARGEPGRRSFHYHLVVHGTPAWRKLVVFRDYLRRHPGVAAEYGALKARLAEQFPASRAAYMASKRPVLRAIMRRGFAEEGRRRHAEARLLNVLLEDEPAATAAWAREKKALQEAVGDEVAARGSVSDAPEVVKEQFLDEAFEPNADP